MAFKSTTTLLQGLTQDSLAYMAKNQRVEVAAEAKKKQLVSAIASEIESLGLVQMTAALSKIQLESFTADMEKKETDNAGSKLVLRRCLERNMIKEGIHEFITKMEDKQVKELIKVLGEEPSTDKEFPIADQLYILIQRTGTEVFFSRFEVSRLREFMEDLSLECSTSSKQSIIRSITDNHDAEAEKTVKEITFSKKKLKLEQGITYHDIFQWYTLEELQEWSKKEGLKVSGTKKVVINRILAYLDGDKENTMAKPKTEKVEKVEAEKVEKKKSKKAAKKEETAETTEETAEESTEKVEKTKKSKKADKERSRSKSPAKKSKSPAKKDDAEEGEQDAE